MTLLSMCQQVARISNIIVPTTIVGNNEGNARILLACAQEEGRQLARGKIPGGLGQHNWQSLVKEYNFNTASSTISYSLPSDFSRFIGDTWWNRTKTHALRLITNQRWQYDKGAINASIGLYTEMRLRGNQILLYPTPSSTDSIYYEYLSTQWCESSGGTDQSAWVADTDTGIISEDLMGLGILWRFKRSIGDQYADEKDEYEQEVRLAMGNDGGRTIIGGDDYDGSPMLNIPENGWGS